MQLPSSTAVVGIDVVVWIARDRNSVRFIGAVGVLIVIPIRFCTTVKDVTIHYVLCRTVAGLPRSLGALHPRLFTKRWVKNWHRAGE